MSRSLGLLVLVVLVGGMLVVSANLAEAQSEPKYKLVNPTMAQLPTRQLLVAPNVKIDLRKFVTNSSMKNSARTRAAFTSNFRRKFLSSAPRYNETIESLGDRLLVTRTLNLDFKDPCDPKIPTELGVCFRPSRKGKGKGKGLKPEVTSYLRKTRTKLKNLGGKRGPKSAEFQRLQAMTDKQLLDELLNKRTTKKVITHKSVLPYGSFEFGKIPKNLNIHDPKVRLPKGIASPAALRRFTRATSSSSATTVAPVVGGDEGSRPRRSSKMSRSLRFDTTSEHTQPLVMGWTVGRQFGHTFEVEFAEETTFTDRYFARFEFTVGFGIGLRLPLEVTAKSKITKVAVSRHMISNYPATRLCPGAEGDKSKASVCAMQAEIEVSARSIPVGESNGAFYEKAGMPKTQIFSGREFLLEGGITCSLRLSVPGPDPHTLRCPSSFLKSFSHDFQTKLGADGHRRLFRKVFDGRQAGLGYDLGLAYAVIDPGLTVDADRVSLSFDVKNWNSTGAPKKLSISTANKTMKIAAKIPSGTKPWGVELRKPVYRLGATVSPTMNVRIGVDLGAVEWSYSFGPIIMGRLELPTLEFPAHEGTNPAFRLQVGKSKKL